MRDELDMRAWVAHGSGWSALIDGGLRRALAYLRRRAPGPTYRAGAAR